MNGKHPSHSHRRSFLALACAGVGGFMTRPALARSFELTSKNEKLRTAHIGVGGMGGGDLNSIASHKSVEVAALCDVDSDRLAVAAAKHPNAKTFADFREMLASLDDKIDAVIVSTPDHTHAPAAMTAMNLGKPVYCQKPLTHEAFEARRLREIADEKSLVTQMGVQIHSHQAYREAVAIIQSGALGKISRVLAWSNKNWGFDGQQLPPSAPPPENLDWNLWLGTAAERDYVPGVYHPGVWRKMVDFGTGTLGDMGVHIFDTPYTALELTTPNWVRTTCRAPTGIGQPEANKVEYEFPGTKHTTATLSWIWFDGSMAPPPNKELGLPEEEQLPGQGSLFVGENGTLLLPHVASAKLFPEKQWADYKRPEVEGNNHYHQFVDACLGTTKTSMPFQLGGPLTEALLLGIVANRFPEEKLIWNASDMTFKNSSAASELIYREYRHGFEVENLSSAALAVG